MAKSKYNYAQGMGFVPVKCPICGKMFVPAPEHAYHNYNGKKLVCSYKCSCQSRKEHPDYPKRAFYAVRRQK